MFTGVVVLARAALTTARPFAILLATALTTIVLASMVSLATSYGPRKLVCINIRRPA